MKTLKFRGVLMSLTHYPMVMVVVAILFIIGNGRQIMAAMSAYIYLNYVLYH